MMARTLLLLLLTSLTAACATPGQSSASAPTVAENLPADLSDYRLGIGDRVRIQVFNEPDLTLEATVDPTGRINYPLLGSVSALKKTAAELQDILSSSLANGYLVNPDVRVVVIGYRPFYIIGQIRKPGAYPYVVGLTVEKALAIAGGLTNLASTRRIYLLREDAPVETRSRVGLGTHVLPGDTVMIEEGLF